MRSLFGKIFLSFWLMMILTIMVTVGVIRFSEPESNELPPHLSKAVVKAEIAYQKRGEKGLKGWTNRINSRGRPNRVYVIKDDTDILNRPIPPFVQKVAQNISKSQKTLSKRRGQDVFFGYYLTDYRGSGYKLVFNHPPKPGDIFRHLLRNIWLVFLLIALITGLSCFLLARNFSRPIKTMQQATTKLAEGDLEVQVANEFRGRKDEIGDLARDFDLMTQQLKHVYHHQSRLIQDMSHELRAPISRMQVALALLEDESDLQSDHGQAMLARLQTEITQFDEIIKHTLALPLFEQDHVRLDSQEDILVTLNKLLEDYQFENQSELDIQLTTSPQEGPFLIYSADNWLRTILSNLINNALQYKAEKTAIEIQLKTTENNHTLTVTNQSACIEEEQLNHVFEPFYRADMARTPGTTNLGLGLSIVKGLVTRLGGQINAEKVALENNLTGFRVTITLPNTNKKG